MVVTRTAHFASLSRCAEFDGMHAIAAMIYIEEQQLKPMPQGSKWPHVQITGERQDPLAGQLHSP